MSPIIQGWQWIGNEKTKGLGEPFSSFDPASGTEIWHGNEASESQIGAAVDSARKTFPLWRKTPFNQRLEIISRFASLLEQNRDELALLISREAGKPLWESQTEVSAMIAKVGISAEAHHERCSESSRQIGDAISTTRFKPHGAVAVFGPFNFPGHTANGHIIPALLAGNTVIFKPSELTPATAQKTAELWQMAGIPDGTINLIQGGPITGQKLTTHPGLNGIFFTGSHQTGIAISRQLANHPEKILALELGGNNPLLIFDPDDITAAAILTIQSAFITTGQRCTCARRLILPDSKPAQKFLSELIRLTTQIRIGPFSDRPEPFIGPLISEKAAEKLLKKQDHLIQLGAEPLLACEPFSKGKAFVTPGIIDVTNLRKREDREIFGPLLQLIRVSDFPAAIKEANATRFGLAAGLFSNRRDLRDLFFDEIHAGVLTWNQQMTGASSRAPFGGLGQSGNHRPSGYLSADYCSTAIATTEKETLSLPSTLPPGIIPDTELPSK